MSFADVSAVTAIEGGFTAQGDPAWLQGRFVYGGLMMAWAVRAMAAVVDDPARALRTLQAELLTSPGAEAVFLSVRVLRRGRSATQLCAELSDGQRPFAMVTATFAEPRARDADFDQAAPPEVPAADQLIVLPHFPMMPAFAKNFEFRFAWGGAPLSQAERAETGAWVRLAEPPPVFDDALVIGTLDAIWPAFLPRLAAMRPIGTVSFAAHLFPRSPALTPEVPVLLLADAQRTADGYCSQENTLWGPDGSLIARGIQLVAIVK
ncbi:MAG: thioesterase family protein [Alphaproteobacteria bacterium]|nr:thioesterase family protein [Alphaproteobacteria bacterium]